VQISYFWLSGDRGGAADVCPPAAGDQIRAFT
jgi:hypothetical protein